MNKYLLLAAPALIALASCSSENELTGESPTSPNSPTQEQTAIEFGTYIGRQVTRASQAGDISTDVDLANKGGFGVFAYYTGNKTYNEAQYSSTEGTVTPTVKPNFMYNQQVTGTVTGSEGSQTVSGWTYTPKKYWPNDISATAGGAVDPTDVNGATGNAGGGYVSFFAYAPYNDERDTDVGITNMSANNIEGDPTVTYTISNGTKISDVDLLWGTMSSTAQNVLGQGNAGVTGKASGTAGATAYEQALTTGEKTNADLTKQKVGDNKIGFAFKHALAGIGGSSTTISGTTVGGFQVKLDLESDAGAIDGGPREKFKLSESSTAEDAWRTIVTIKNVSITNDLNGNKAINDTDSDNPKETGLAQKGTLNLATGVWAVAEDDKNSIISQTTGTDGDTEGSTYNAVLNTKIAEYKKGESSTATWISGYSTTTDYFAFTNAEDETKVHPGVTETAQNIYEGTQTPILLIPGQKPKFLISVDYVVRTYDKNLDGGYSEVPQKISKIVEFEKAVEINKRYSILMHLGLTDVKFTASVSSWSVDTTTTGEGDDATTKEVPIDVYLPKNTTTN